MKKYVNATSDARSRARMSDDLDIEINELVELATEFAERDKELTDMGLASVLEDVEKMTSTLRRNKRNYLDWLYAESILTEYLHDITY